MQDAEFAGFSGITGTVGTAEQPGAAVLPTRAAAEAYVASVCFKHGPPRLVGVELEWLLEQIGPPTPIGAPAQLSPADLVAALGPHAPTTLDPASPALPLPGGSTVTVEPGGQVEMASPPLAGLTPLLDRVRSDADHLHRLLAARGLRPQPRAADPVRPPHRVLDIPRYRAMEQSFDRIGPHGRSGMCSTAAVQVCLDAGERADVALRWAAVHAIGPPLLGAFANSPLLHGRRTGWKSSRMACWLTLDPARTAPPAFGARDPAAQWSARVLDTPLLCVRRDGVWDVPSRVSFADWIGGAFPVPPTVADLDYHISTLFPPVRPRGHLEIRYVDAQPGHGWALPTAVLTALMSSRVTVQRALEIAAPAADRWVGAARHGLADRVVARAAAGLFSLACEVLPTIGGTPELLEELVEVTLRRVLAGRCPADAGAPGDDRAASACSDTPEPAAEQLPAPSAYATTADAFEGDRA